VAEGLRIYLRIHLKILLSPTSTYFLIVSKISQVPKVHTRLGYLSNFDQKLVDDGQVFDGLSPCGQLVRLTFGGTTF
jgi:hypothetical protein